MGLLKNGQWIIIRINRTGQGGFMNEKFYALPKEKQEFTKLIDFWKSIYLRKGE